MGWTRREQEGRAKVGGNIVKRNSKRAREATRLRRSPSGGRFFRAFCLEFAAVGAQNLGSGGLKPPRFSAHFGDKFGESLGGSQAPPSFWEVPGLPRKFPKLPRKFFGDFPGSSLTVEPKSNPRVPRKFPRLPRKFPGLPRKFPGLPRRLALSLGSLTPSPDSQKLSLNIWSNLSGHHSFFSVHVVFPQVF